MNTRFSFRKYLLMRPSCKKNHSIFKTLDKLIQGSCRHGEKGEIRLCTYLDGVGSIGSLIKGGWNYDYCIHINGIKFDLNTLQDYQLSIIEDYFKHVLKEVDKFTDRCIHISDSGACDEYNIAFDYEDNDFIGFWIMVGREMTKSEKEKLSRYFDNISFHVTKIDYRIIEGYTLKRVKRMNVLRSMQNFLFR